jgi:hypothetical protein
MNILLIKTILLYSNIFLLFTSFSSNDKKHNKDSNDPHYLFYEQVSKINIEKDDKIIDAIILFKKYYQELIKAEIEILAQKEITEGNEEFIIESKRQYKKNLENLKKLEEYPLSRLTWGRLVRHIYRCSKSNELRALIESDKNQNLKNKLEKEYSILNEYAKRKNISIMKDKYLFFALRLIRLARDDKGELDHHFKDYNFKYLKELLPNIFHDIYKSRVMLNSNLEEAETDYQSFLNFQNYLYIH